MNRDLLQIQAELMVSGWKIRQIGKHGTLVMGDKVATIRPDRSIEIVVGAADAHFCYVQAYKGRGWLDLAVSIATAAARSSLTGKQFGVLLHAIGGGEGRYARPGYRNFYAAGEGDVPCLESLVESGHMFTIWPHLYHVTPKGAAEVGCAGCLERK